MTITDTELAERLTALSAFAKRINDMSNKNTPEPTYAAAYPDEFDRARGALDGVASHTRPSTIIVSAAMGVGGEKTFVVETFRQRDDMGDGKTGPARDTVFLRVIGSDGGKRYVLPPKVADVIAAQRESLNIKERKASARKGAATRRANMKVAG